MKNFIFYFYLFFSLLTNAQTVVVDQITVETTDFCINNVSNQVMDYITTVINIETEGDFLDIHYHVIDSLSIGGNRQVYVFGIEQSNSLLEWSEVGIYATLIQDGKNQGGFDLYRKGSYYWMDNLDQANILDDSILYSSNLETKENVAYCLTSHLYKSKVPNLLDLRTTNRQIHIDKTIYEKTLSSILLVQTSKIDTFFYLNTYKLGDDIFYLLLNREDKNNGVLQIVQVRNNAIIDSLKVGELISKDGILLYYERPEIFYKEEEKLIIKIYDSTMNFREINYKRM